MKNHKILVTGGAGFIGSHLTERLLKEQNHVTILDSACTLELRGGVIVTFTF